MTNSLRETKAVRDDFADFIKYLLIWFVVLGHFINPYQHNVGITGSLYNFLYSFHMPLFVFISGYFSKHLNSYRRKNIDTLLYPFIVFQLLNIVYTWIFPLELLEHNIFYPYHQNWYLLALFWWRTFSPYKQFFNDIVVIGFSILISLGVGFIPEWSGFMGLYKTAYFLPFFILGSYCEDLSKLLNKLMSHKKLWITLLCFVMLSVILLSFNKDTLDIINYAFKADMGYNNGVLSLVIRTCSMGVSVLLCYAVLVIANILYNRLGNRRLCFVRGGGTVLAFLGHEFIMIPLIRVYMHICGYKIGFFLCIITSIIVTYILTRKVIVEFFCPLLDLSVLCKKLGVNIFK